MDIIHPDDLERTSGEFRQAIREKRNYRLRYRVRKKNGKYFWAEDIGNGLFDSDGKLEYIQGVWYDVSEIVKTEDSLKVSEEKI